MNSLITMPQKSGALQTAQAYFSGNLYNRYLSYLDVSKASASTYSRMLKQMFAYFRLADIRMPRREDLIAYRNYLLEVKGAKPATVQCYMASARLFFKWTESEGIYPNIANNLKGVKVSSAPKKSYLTPEQMIDVLQTAKGNSIQALRDYALISLLASCGLRTIEAVRADVGDIRAVGSVVMLFVQGKGKDDKTGVKLPVQVQQHLNAYLKARKAKASEPLFISLASNHQNKRMTTRSISRIIKNHLVEAGIDSPFYTAHSLRHTAVTLAVKSGIPIQEVQQFARHSKIDTTMIYVHAMDAEKNACSDTVANMIFN